MNLILIVTIFIVISICSIWKISLINDEQDLKCFNVDNTLPLRGVLSLFIVANHIVANYATPCSFFTTFGAPSVAIFFFISGYGLVCSFESRGLHHFFRRRLGKILPLFVFLTFLAGSYTIFISGYSFKYAIIERLLAGEPALPFSWFIYAIIIFYAIFFIACRIGKNNMWRLIIAYFLTAGYVALARHYSWGVYWYNAAFAFPIGMTICMYEQQLRGFLVQYKFISLLILLMFAGAYYYLHANYIIAFVPLVAIVGVYAFGMISNTILRLLGKLSLEIYLFHGLLFFPLLRIGLSWWIFTIALYTSTIVCSYMWHIAQQKCMDKFLSVR